MLLGDDSPHANERIIDRTETPTPDTPKSVRNRSLAAPLTARRVDHTPRAIVINQVMQGEGEDITGNDNQTLTYTPYEGLTPRSPDTSVLDLIKMKAKLTSPHRESKPVIPTLPVAKLTDLNDCDANAGVEKKTLSSIDETDSIIISPKAKKAWVGKGSLMDRKSDNDMCENLHEESPSENFIIIKRASVLHRSHKYRPSNLLNNTSSTTSEERGNNGKCGRNCSIM